MSLDALIMLAGAFVAVLPFLGFPNSWDSALLFLAGIFIISLGIILRRREGRAPHTAPPQKEDAFADGGPNSHTHEST